MNRTNLFSRKPLSSPQPGRIALRRHLGPWHLTFMGVGGTIGAGIFVLSGTVAANYAGPAVAVSYVLAALACGCAALCYSEFASMSDEGGSAYLYVYRSLGLFPAWMIGWSLILEYLFSAATVAVGWSGYFCGVLNAIGLPLPEQFSSAPIVFDPIHGIGIKGVGINLPAIAIVSIVGLTLWRGIRESAWLNASLTMVKVLVILLVIGLAASHVRPTLWHPFVPPNQGTFGHFGLSGVLRGAGVVFFAFVGFDMISTAAQESRDPKRDLPIGLLATLAICAVLYVAMALVMTGLVPFRELNVANPIMLALNRAGDGLQQLSLLVGLAAIAGLASALVVSMYGQTRIFMAMAHDGLLPASLGRISVQRRTPAYGTMIVSALVGLAAAFMPVQLLGELASIGTLAAFVAVCVGVSVMRRVEPDAPRAFRVPWGDAFPILGTISCLGLMATLPADTWIRFVVWTTLGLAIFWLRRRSKTSRSMAV
ncbi:amino acid permease [Novosphingobium sp.]|uniref:amino acid permease n=1 Tax=Novosphingobium sp. TaxID=1874826 RepID=UPI0025D0AA45|nr:amino acid permease [Novosphingobium sp.]